MSFDAFLTFRKFITPAFITIIYIVGAIFITVLSIIMIAGGFSAPSYYGISYGGLYVFLGIVMLTLGNIWWRILCEYLIITFRIYDETVSINRKIGPEGVQMPPPPPPPEVRTCPTCGGPLTYIDQYQRWYCYKCKKYV
jgi:hypothetical protein